MIIEIVKGLFGTIFYVNAKMFLKKVIMIIEIVKGLFGTIFYVNAKL